MFIVLTIFYNDILNNVVELTKIFIHQFSISLFISLFLYSFNFPKIIKKLNFGQGIVK